jgi:hypothetical protein
VSCGRLIRVHPETLAGWTSGKDPLVMPAFERFFDFEDIISLLVIAELRRRHVASGEIRLGIEALAAELDVERPLAHIDDPNHLATVGKASSPTSATGRTQVGVCRWHSSR